MHGVPPSGASSLAAGRGFESHGTRPSQALDATTLATMNATLRDSCERIRDRVAELAGTSTEPSLQTKRTVRSASGHVQTEIRNNTPRSGGRAVASSDGRT
jgi:hypothetical protein